MRVTRETRERTRARILETGEALFQRDGYGPTTLRTLAREARIAVGTLFNYFPSKEALAMTLLADALERGAGRFAERDPGATLEEDLFAFVADGLRELRPYRAFVGDVLAVALSPFRSPKEGDPGERARAGHLATVSELLTRHGREPGPGTLHLYWTLYLGVLAHWARDPSRDQEDTLAVLDQSTWLFVRALGDGPNPPRPEERR